MFPILFSRQHDVAYLENSVVSMEFSGCDLCDLMVTGYPMVRTRPNAEEKFGLQGLLRYFLMEK